MNKSVRYAKVKLVNEKTRMLTEQFVADMLRDRNDITKGKSFLRCHIQDWDRFAKVCDEQLGTDLIYFIAMLMAEALDEAGTPDGWLCQSDDSSFTIIDLTAVIPKIRERLQQRFTPEALAQEPVYVNRIQRQVGGDKIPTSLKLVTRIITANDFFQIEDQ